MSRYVVAFCVVLGMATLGAQNKEQSRLENCGVVMEEVLNVPDNIPQELLGKAECVIVIPSMMKVAVGVGASYGRGAMVCRAGKTFGGPGGALGHLAAPRQRRQCAGLRAQAHGATHRHGEGHDRSGVKPSLGKRVADIRSTERIEVDDPAVATASGGAPGVPGASVDAPGLGLTRGPQTPASVIHETTAEYSTQDV